MTVPAASLVLNQDQETAANAIFQFLLSEDKEFSVSGPAGTGKTTLMKHVMTHLLPDYSDACKLLGTKPQTFEIALTATTNKATEVLAQATGFPAQTIHSFMNLKVLDDHKTGVSRISPTRQFQIHNRKLILIDEASMVDKALYEYLQKGTDKTCKIIYLGDRCQMAPVFEKISRVYRNQKHTAELLTPVRNAGQPALMAVCDRLRRNVDTLHFRPIDPVPGVIDYLDDAQAKAFIDATFAAETSAARALCYTNARVTEYNEYIRDLLGYGCATQFHQLSCSNWNDSHP